MARPLLALPGKVDTGSDTQSEEDKKLSKILFESVDAQDINRVKLAVETIKTSINNKTHIYDLWQFDLDVRGKHGISALKLAVCKGNPDIVKEILKSKFCDVNQECNGTALSTAAELGHVEVATILLQDPRIDVNVCRNKQTPLNYAVRKNRPDIVKLFIEDGRFNLNETDSNNNSLLHHATRLGYVEIVKLFLENENCDVNYVNKGDTSFSNAVSWATQDPRPERMQVLELHLRRQPNVELLCGEHNPIYTFMKYMGNVSAYKTSDYYYQCMDYLTDIQGLVSDVPYILAYAVEYSTTEVCALLIKKGASVDSCFPGEEAAIFCALRNNSFSKCKLLVQNGVNLAAEWLEMTPFQFAVAFACLPEIIQLLSQGLDVSVIRETLEQYSFVNETYIDCAKRLKILNCVSSQQSTKKANNVWKYQDIQNSKLSALSSSRIPLKRDVTRDDILRQIILTSPACNTRAELKRIEAQLRALLNFLSTKLKESKDTVHLHFRPIIAGSMAEGTKTFQVDEFDVVCEFIDLTSTELHPKQEGVTIKVTDIASPWSRDTNSRGELIVRNVSRRFYNALRKIIANTTRDKKEAARLFGNLFFHRESLEIKEKISRLQLMWNCNYCQRMVITVDLVPTFPLRNLIVDDASKIKDYTGHHAIAKKSRRSLGSYSFEETEFPYSNKTLDIQKLRSLPEFKKQAYIYAKAVRIADISQPENVEELNLSDTINPEDHITSFLLKQCLFDEKRLAPQLPSPYFMVGKNGIGWAEKIYCLLEEFLKGGIVGIETVGGYGEYIIKCKHKDHNVVVRECCRKKRVALILCGAITAWLRRNSRALREQLKLEKHSVYSRYDQSGSFGEFLLLNSN